ncbi:MAG: hypothetical protein BGO69_08800 [Bacteroidetes bacterium 46-16]|nr:MAG: hypothetical protein BGO69_08800 [Bacteroidetes bacterium 46-16]
MQKHDPITRDAAALEPLLRAQLKDNTPTQRHLPGDDFDHDLATEEISVELYKDAYAIYFREPGYRDFFEFRTANYMALLRFNEGKMQMSIIFKPWRRKWLYVSVFFLILFMVFDGYIMGSWRFPSLLIVLLAGAGIMLSLEKDRFQKRVNKYLRALLSGKAPYFT